MISLVIRGVSWKAFAAGAATALVGGAVARPLLVTATKAGIGLKSAVSGAYQKARDMYSEATKAREDSGQVDGLVSEIKLLRADVDALKTQSASPKTKQP